VRNLLYIVLILTALSSCNKNDDNYSHNPCVGDETISYINSLDLQNCRYKTNSYWVYTDSVTNSLDSVSIDNFNQDFIEDECGNSYEIHSFKTISSYSSKSINYVVVAGGLFKGFDGTPNSGTLIYDDFNTTSPMSNYLIERFDSLFIYNQYFRNVLRVEIENDPTENHNKSLYFINSEFGFLRHDIYSDNILISRKLLIRKDIAR